jgi:hypothetical protein
MKQANWRIRGAALAASSGLVTIVLLACSGDDTSTTGPDAASTQDSSTIDASSHETSTSEASSGDSASIQDVVVADTAKSNDGAAEADASLPPIVPLQLCGPLDTDWGLTPPVTDDDRATPGGWDFDGALGTVPLTFGEALTSDCEMYGLQSTLNADAGYGVGEYLDQVAAFTLQFLGCGFPEAGALSFTGLMPATALNQVWTQADLDRLAAMYSNAVVEAASYGWAATYFNNGAPPSDVPLTDDQVSAINAQLAALEAQAIAGHAFVYDDNTTKFNFSTCTVDAGSDAANGD